MIPSADDPLARIRESVRKYEEYFSWLRIHFPGKIAYLTGIPTEAYDTGPEHPDPDKPKTETWLPVINTPVYRYKYQKIFYEEMKILCDRLKIPFLDACTPFLNADGYLDRQYRNPKDKYHLRPDLKSCYFNWLDQQFGFVSSEPFESIPGNGKWDGSYSHYEQIMRCEIRRLSRNGKNIDFDHLMTSGALDSLAVIELIHLLETIFEVEIDLGSIRKKDYESLSGMYDRFVKLSPSLRQPGNE